MTRADVNQDKYTEPAKREWVKPAMEIVAMKEAMGGVTGPHDGPFSYS